MKKGLNVILILTVIFSSLIIVSCGKDSNNENSSANTDVSGTLHESSTEQPDSETTAEVINSFRIKLNAEMTGQYACEAEITREVDKTKCIVKVTDGDKNPNFEFYAPLNMIDNLQNIICDYELEKIDGHNVKADGISQENEAYLEVNYESGKKIYAYDSSEDPGLGEASDVFYAFLSDLVENFAPVI